MWLTTRTTKTIDLFTKEPIDGSKSAHFRGRKLAGKTVKLPEQCRGVVVEKREEKAAEPQVTDEYADADPEAQSESFGTIQVTAEFDEMVVWGHEMMADAASDPYVRSMEEWLQVSDKVRAIIRHLENLLLTHADSLIFMNKEYSCVACG